MRSTGKQLLIGAYNRGYADGKRGRARTENPFTTDARQRIWYIGWDDVFNDNKKAKFSAKELAVVEPPPKPPARRVRIGVVRVIK